MKNKNQNARQFSLPDYDEIFTPEELAQMTEEQRKTFDVLDKLCGADNGQAASKLADEYLWSIQDAPSQQIAFNAEASLKAFQQQHKEIFMPPPTPVEKVSVRRRRYFRKTIRAIIAAVLILCTLTMFTFASSNMDLIVEWGQSVLRIRSNSHSDYRASEDGNTAFFDDGVIYTDFGLDPTLEEQKMYLAGEMTKEEIEERHKCARWALESRTKIEEARMVLLPNTCAQPLDVPSPIQTIEETGTIHEVAERYGVSAKLLPKWVPDRFVQVRVQAITDSDDNSVDVFAEYHSGNHILGIKSCHYNQGEDLGMIEKDYRPIEEYHKNGATYYLNYNLDTVGAIAIIGDRSYDFWGHISMDELKQIIDSIYEEE